MKGSKGSEGERRERRGAKGAKGSEGSEGSEGERRGAKGAKGASHLVKLSLPDILGMTTTMIFGNIAYHVINRLNVFVSLPCGS